MIRIVIKYDFSAVQQQSGADTEGGCIPPPAHSEFFPGAVMLWIDVKTHTRAASVV